MSLHICFFQIYDLKVLRNRTFPSPWLHLGADSTQRSSRFRILPFWLLKKASLKDCDMKTNEDRKLLLFYLISGGGGARLHVFLRVWSTTLPCLIVVGGIISGGEGFSSNLSNGEVKTK